MTQGAGGGYGSGPKSGENRSIYIKLEDDYNVFIAARLHDCTEYGEEDAK
jgi:hypothetical protein